MTNPLRILIAEDSADDAEVTLLGLTGGGVTPDARRVETADEMRAALAEEAWDVVLSDFTMPGFGAVQALALCRDADPDIPVVVVSGTIGERQAVEMMRAGAGDYLLKGNLARLPAAVEREVREAENRRARRRAEQAASLLAAIVESSADAIISGTLEGFVTSWNAAAERLFGWARLEAVGRHFSFLVPADGAGELAEVMGRLRRGERGERGEPFDSVRLHKDGTRIDVLVTASPVLDAGGRVVGVSKVVRDVRGEKRAALAVRASEARFRALVEKSYDGVVLLDASGTVLYASPSAGRIGGRDPEGYVGRRIHEFEHPDEVPPHAAGLRELIRHPGGSFTGEGRLLHADGSWRWVERVFTNMLDDPAVGAVVVNFRDVTERKQAEAEARQAGDLLRAVAEGTTDAVFVKDRASRYLLANPAAAGFMGRPVAEILGRDDTEFFDPEGARQVVEHDRRVMESGEAVTWEERLTSGGVTRTYLATKAPRRDAGGCVVGVVGVSRDITDRKLAEDALREKEALLQTIITHIPCGVFWKDRDSVLLGCNARFARDFGSASPEDLIGKTDDDLASPADAAAFVARDHSVIDTGEPLSNVEETRSWPDGRTTTVLTSKVPLRGPGGAVIGVLGVYLDITDRKRVEDALREKEARLAEAVRIARMGYWSRDLATGDLDWSDELFGIFGVDPSAFGRTLDSFLATLHPDDREAVRGRIAGAEGSIGSFDHSYRVVVRGEIRVIHEAGRVIVSEDGTPCRVAGTAQDVTERTRAEDALRLRDRAIGAATQGIVITDPSQPDGPIVYASPSFERLTGYAAGEAVGRNCRFLQGKDTDPDAVGRVREAVRDGRACTVELLNYRKDGSTFWNELSVSPVRDERGRLTHFVGVQTDVTRRRLLEEQFRQSQKMDAFGQLAGGVAHDFNNLLTVINGYSELLLMRMPPGDPDRGPVEEIHKAGELSAALTRQLLVFSRKQVVAPKVLDLDALVSDAEKMLRRMIGEDVRLETILGRHAGRVKADPGQLEQVLMNLAVNARDAMPQGGRLTIQTSDVGLDGEYAEAHPGVRPGRYALLSVTDTGTGMTEEVRSRIFEPFYTTKGVGKGTGLGLAVVHGIVEEAGGHIAVRSEVGVGTTFEVYLPRVDQPVASRPSRSGHRPAPRGAETVLVVEDEDGVRALTRLVLAGSDYAVLEAADGDEALDIAARHSGPIHLLVTDVVMPGLGGRELADRVLALHPEAKVLYVSGYTDDAVVRHGVLEEQVHFLQKPFSPRDLATKVREVLDSPVPDGVTGAVGTS